jgi:SAM-dependent methyltransferase
MLYDKLTRSVILDFGCGPGLYGQRLADLGHRYHGVDFGPAAIEYAIETNRHGDLCSFILADIRTVELDRLPIGFCDLVMIVFGELNVFSPIESQAIIEKAYAALAPGGHFLVELQSFETVQKVGNSASSWYKSESGLFFDRSHICLNESVWDEDLEIAFGWFHIVDGATDDLTTYRSTTQAWGEGRFEKMITDAGFRAVSTYKDWPQDRDEFVLWAAQK